METSPLRSRRPEAARRWIGIQKSICTSPVAAKLLTSPNASQLVGIDLRAWYRSWTDDGQLGSYSGPEVLGLYRKREGARRRFTHRDPMGPQHLGEWVLSVTPA